MLLRCCLVHICVIIMRPFLYLLYFCPCLDLGLLMSDVCNLLFFFSIFIRINYIISLIQTFFLLLIFQSTSYYFWMIIWMKNVSNFQIGWCLAFAYFFCQFQLCVAYKRFSYKKIVQYICFLYLLTSKLFFQNYIEMELKIFFIIFQEFFEWQK